MDEPTTPYDLTNERAVLGACLLDRDAITAVRDILSLEDFYLEKHVVIYRAMLDLVERRIPPDMSTVAGELRAAGTYDTAGGLSYLGELAADVPTAVHVTHYAQRVLETSGQRRAIQLAAEMHVRAMQGGSVEALFSDFQAMVEVNRVASTPRANWQESVVPARVLYRHKFEVVPFTIEDILPIGTTLLTGKPKTYKSWLALNVAIAVAAGGKALGRYQATQGDALYIDLEMGAARLHKRLHVVSPEMDPPRGLQFATKWPPVGEGFETWLRDYLKSHPFTRLIVVDTLVGIRPARKRYEDPYEADKRFAQSLTNLCQEHRISMLLIHHSRKSDGSDVTDDILGTNGLPGGMDNTAILRLIKGEKGAADLYLRGRDIEIDGDLKMKWDSQFAQWNVLDGAMRATITPERRDVLGHLEERQGLRSKELALLMGREEGSTARLLSDMKKAGLVVSTGGRWFVSDDDEG